MSGVKTLHEDIDRWPPEWRERFERLRTKLYESGSGPGAAMSEAERIVRLRYFNAELRKLQDRVGTVPERPRPKTDPNQMTFADRTAPKD